MRVRPRTAFAAAIAACIGGIAAFVMVVTNASETNSPGVRKQNTPPRSLQADVEELFGEGRSGFGAGRADEAAAYERASFAGRSGSQSGADAGISLPPQDECLETEDAMAAIRQASVGVDMDRFALVLRERLASEKNCEPTRRALQAALDSASVTNLVLAPADKELQEEPVSGAGIAPFDTPLGPGGGGVIAIATPPSGGGGTPSPVIVVGGGESSGGGTTPTVTDGGESGSTGGDGSATPAADETPAPTTPTEGGPTTTPPPSNEPPVVVGDGNPPGGGGGSGYAN